ncbi:hypothetical protein SLS53_006843 [Cytospora paraplurivora]|uniref:Uncharacterized protein n=1 Tax=Cytospora paraplurivora TaxID=2898453 RepID=A0AAN9U2C1_9PEZI
MSATRITADDITRAENGQFNWLKEAKTPHPENYRTPLAKPHELPVFRQRQASLEIYQQTRVVVLSSDTWLGKTTEIPSLVHFHDRSAGLQAHERGVNSDLLMGMLRYALTKRADLHGIDYHVMMSATMDAKQLQDYYLEMNLCTRWANPTCYHPTFYGGEFRSRFDAGCVHPPELRPDHEQPDHILAILLEREIFTKAAIFRDRTCQTFKPFFSIPRSHVINRTFTPDLDIGSLAWDTRCGAITYNRTNCDRTDQDVEGEEERSGTETAKGAKAKVETAKKGEKGAKRPAK